MFVGGVINFGEKTVRTCLALGKQPLCLGFQGFSLSPQTPDPGRSQPCQPRKGVLESKEMQGLMAERTREASSSSSKSSKLFKQAAGICRRKSAESAGSYGQRGYSPELRA